MVRDENEVYAEWQAAEGYERDEKLGELVGLMKEHARGVQVLLVGERDEMLVADAIWQAISRVDQFQGKSKFSSWFESIVRNLIKSKYRTKWDSRYTERQQVELDGFEQSSLENPESAARVQELLGLMGETERAIVELVSQGYTEKEIAEKLHLSEATVNWKKTRLREKLRCLGQSGRTMALILAL